MRTMIAAYLTPKPSIDGYKLPACPPPPRGAHKPIDLQSFPSLNFPCCFKDAISSDDANGLFLADPGVTTKSMTKNLPAKRSRDGRITKPLSLMKLKPRPSKYSAPSRTALSLSSSGKTGLHSMTRSSSFHLAQRAYLMSSDTRRPKLPRRPSFSRVA
mmetsp:Transcript_15263/g.27748  ORF Transcript_15263/g.27748 Transcript_15263/m.27748 type:complete len:158 (-) Transcript_15263:164-637(-)